MKNNIQNILVNKGFAQVIPTEEQLKKLGCKTLYRFNQILNNKVELSASELVAFENWLNVSTEEIIVEK